MSIAENIARVREDISRAARAAGTDPAAVTLVGVTKYMPLSDLEAARAAGLFDFGENYPQHLAEKAPNFSDIRWHFIGHLQTNKVKSIIGCASLVQSVDSLRLADALDRAAAARNAVQDVLIQVNIGREPQKSGILPEELEALLAEAAVREHIRVRGLMAIPPRGDSPEESRPYFAAMRTLFDRWQGADPRIDMRYLSMGMSMDFVPAIGEGANMVRVGSAIFGARPTK